MHARAMLFGFGLLLLGATRAAEAGDNAPVIVVPTRPDVPVIIDGQDASWAVVEGDVGLYRPGHQHPTVIGGRLLGPGWTPRGYFPGEGRRPRYGRLEIQPPPNRRLPPPAEPYFRSWGTQSDPTPVTTSPPYEPPQINVNIDPSQGEKRDQGPPIGRDGHGRRRLIGADRPPGRRP